MISGSPGPSVENEEDPSGIPSTLSHLAAKQVSGNFADKNKDENDRDGGKDALMATRDHPSDSTVAGTEEEEIPVINAKAPSSFTLSIGSRSWSTTRAGTMEEEIPVINVNAPSSSALSIGSMTSSMTIAGTEEEEIPVINVDVTSSPAPLVNNTLKKIDEKDFLAPSFEESQSASLTQLGKRSREEHDAIEDVIDMPR